MATQDEILKRAAELCRKDGFEWEETSASEASWYTRRAEREFAATEEK